ncbi:hypothetical protein KBI23_12310 [bacterium]|nr:hypothetical protein [bacterium]MBP9810692.1 hypothetical protein [bacterium]
MKKFPERTSALLLSLSLFLQVLSPIVFLQPVNAAEGETSTSTSSSASSSSGLPSEVTGIEPVKTDTPAASETSTATSTGSSIGASSAASSSPATTNESYTDPVIVRPVIDLPHIKEAAAASAHAQSGLAGSASKAATATPVVKPIQAQATTTKLYGRIEQITSGNGANFPIILKAMTPQLDNSLVKKPLSGAATDVSMFSGTIAKSFPSDYRGNWGGDLTVWRVEQDPICYKIDPEEASKVLKIFKSGAKGSTNFMFAQDTRGGIVLAPAKVMFSVPGKDIGADQQMAQMMGGQSFANMGPMGQMMQQMAQSMPVPVIFSFGDIQSSQYAKGLSGNEFVQRTLKNQVRQLAPNVLEQQIVAECNEIMRSTGQPRKRYEESVLRFTKVNSQQMYVQAAQVVFGQDRKFQQKIVMYGYVTKGQVANTNPYSGMMQMMQPGQSGQSPFGGAGNPFGGGMPQFPPGSNPFQGLFGQ